MRDSKILLVYYSRTGNTRRIAEAISRELHCDIEEIHETRIRLGLIEFVKSCFEALRRHQAHIGAMEHDPKSYDLLIIGTPVWAGSVSTPVRAYLASHKWTLPDVAFFCTLGHQGSNGAFLEMQKLVAKPPRTCCAVMASQIAAGTFQPDLTRFVRELGERGRPDTSTLQINRVARCSAR